MVDLVPYTIKLYGSNSSLNALAGSLVTLASVTALSDLVSLELDCWGYYETNESEGEIVKGEGDTKIEIVKRRKGWTFKLAQYDATEDLANVRAVYTVLNKRNKFITEVLSPYLVTMHPANMAISCYIEDEEENEGGLRAIVLKCHKKKLE